MPEIWLLYSTFANRNEALSVAERLLGARLIACANVIGGVTSLYRWEGAVQREEEAVLIAKTTRQQVPAAIEAIKKAHSYELPCVVAWPLMDGSAAFLEWVAGEIPART
jgi:periplasmic divalent cation tolerance protein